MNVRKVIRKRIRHEGKGTSVTADVNAAVVVNRNDPGSVSSVRSRQRIVQRSGGKPEPDEGGGSSHG